MLIHVRRQVCPLPSRYVDIVPAKQELLDDDFRIGAVVAMSAYSDVVQAYIEWPTLDAVLAGIERVTVDVLVHLKVVHYLRKRYVRERIGIIHAAQV